MAAKPSGNYVVCSLGYSAGMSQEHFWGMIDILEKTNVAKKIKTLGVPEAFFMFRAKFRKNLPFDALGAHLSISPKSAWKMFWTLAFEYFEVANQIQRTFVNPKTEDDAKNALYEEMYKKYDPLHRFLADSFADPLFEKTGKKRQNVFILIDSKAFACMKSADEM